MTCRNIWKNTWPEKVSEWKDTSLLLSRYIAFSVLGYRIIISSRLGSLFPSRFNSLRLASPLNDCASMLEIRLLPKSNSVNEVRLANICLLIVRSALSCKWSFRNLGIPRNATGSIVPIWFLSRLRLVMAWL